MSYRKPAPVYIPSPPPSPPASAVPSTREKDGKEIPPLPDNWQEVLSFKASERNMSTQTFEPLTGSSDDQLELDTTEQAPVVPEKPPRYSTNLISDESVRSLAIPQAHQLPNVRTTRARGLPREYRPPTPPLPSQNMRALDIVAGDGPPISVTPPLRKLYPTGSSLSIFNHHHQPIARGSSLRTTPSFRTEETMGSWYPLSTRQTSRGMGTLTDVTMYGQKRAINASTIMTENTLAESIVEVSCWEAAGGLGELAKKVLDFLFVCK